jgi:inner membrane protein
MVYKPGHIGGALLAYSPLFAWFLTTGRYLTAAAGLVAAFGTATLPDVDLRIPDLPHRGPTHSIVFLVGTVGTVMLLGFAIGVPMPITTGVVTGLAVAIASHIILDGATKMGVRPFWPVSDRRIRLPPHVRSASPGANLSF